MTAENQTSKRTIELELQLMHLQNDYDSLNEVVLQHQKSIDDLKSTVQRLTAKFESQQDSPEQRSLEDEKPPHY